MKYCIKCGAQLKDDAKFCSKCGTACHKGEGNSENMVKPEKSESVAQSDNNMTEDAGKPESISGSPLGSSKRNVIIIVIGLVLIIAAIAIFLSQKASQKPDVQKPQETSVPVSIKEETVPETIQITEADTEVKTEETAQAVVVSLENQNKEPESIKEDSAKLTDSELCRLAIDYYYALNGVKLSAMVDSSNGDTATIRVFENLPDHIVTMDWYTVSRTSGKGTDLFENEINLFSPSNSSENLTAESMNEKTVSHVIDDAGIFTSSEIDSINNVLSSAEKSMGTDILILTTNNKGGKTLREYADDSYDNQMFKGNVSPDGVGIVIDMEGRTCYITTTGVMIRYLTDERIEQVLDSFFDTYAADNSFSESVVEMINTITRFYNEGIPANQYTILE